MLVPCESRRTARVCAIGCGAAAGAVILAVICRKRKKASA